MTPCRICGSGLEPFLSFGRMPRGNGFLRPEEFPNEYFFDLRAAFCPSCAMVQLVEQPDREQMFNDRYPFFTGSSRRMVEHFEEFAEDLRRRFLGGPDPFVVEIGSNDGTMLASFAREGIRHLGVEPSSNVAQAAMGRGLRILCDFFSPDLASRITQEQGQADLVAAANVFCHIADLPSAAVGIRRLLKPGGVVCFEDPYLGDVIEKTSYDQFYDEHVYLFSVTAVRNLFEPHGLRLIDVQPQATHGGSMRFTLAHSGARPASPAVAAALEREKRLELDRWETYDEFRRRCEESREQLAATLARFREEGRRVVGYGATSKSTTVINYCRITTDWVESICDTTPLKQGTFSPGAHIPIRPHEAFKARYPDLALLFAWNHQAEILEKEGEFQRRGGRWILYVPRVVVWP